MLADRLRGHRLTITAAALLSAHVVGLVLQAVPAARPLATAARVLVAIGTPVVLLAAWALSRIVDRAIARVPSLGWDVRGGLVRIGSGMALVGLVPAIAPLVARLGPGTAARGLGDIAMALAAPAGFVVLALGLGDVRYRSTAPLKHLSTRLMVLLCVASVATLLWVDSLAGRLFAVVGAVLERGHLVAYARGMMLVTQALGERWGGLAAALLLNLLPTLLLAWRFSQNATRGLEALRLGFARVAQGDLNGTVTVDGNDEVADMQRAFNAMLLTARERRFLENAFSRYVSPVLLDRLRRRTDGTVRLPAERRIATVLFSDIRGFTAMSSALSPEEVIALLNTYMSLMIEVIARHDGYINKFVGDSIMVVWNAPVDQAHHARSALTCALAMQEELARANAEGIFGPRKLSMGIGVNTGPLVAGNLGNRRQLEFTVVGDTVNVASRVCQNAGGGDVRLTHAVVDSLAAGGDDEGVEWRSVGLVPMKGKGVVELLELVAVEDDARELGRPAPPPLRLVRGEGRPGLGA